MSFNRQFKERLAAGDALLGHWVSVANSTVLEVMARLPCDFLLLDGEHAPIRPDDLVSLLPASDLHGKPVIFRPRSRSDAHIKAALDAGVAGIMVPMVETAAQARAIVEAAHYAPLGRRGIGPLRASSYYDSFDDYLLSASGRTTVIVQIESAAGLANVREIAAVDGVNVLYVGPADLAQSLGVPIGIMEGSLLQACETVADAARMAGRVAAIDIVSPEHATMLFERGFRLFTHGSDIGFLQEGGRRTCSEMAALIGKAG